METIQWGSRADEAQTALETLFWNDSIRLYNIETPCPNGECNTIFHYWWMAHAVDVLLDGYLRTRDSGYLLRIRSLYDGIVHRNGGTLPNELYDDMEWMALAWLRAYSVTCETDYMLASLLLWEDIQTGWNDHMGGGIAWRKSQTDYKNTPANAPAVILAARMYQTFGKTEDLGWAHRIYDWQKKHLVDERTGFVWDGMNRNGDGQIDKDWKFTYCQGVFIGAAVELYRVTGDKRYLTDAMRTYRAALSEWGETAGGLLPDEGGGDGGLFKGIFIRYAAELSNVAPTPAEIKSFIEFNASKLWMDGKRNDSALFGTDWSTAPKDIVQLSTQLSAMKLLEQAARL